MALLAGSTDAADTGDIVVALIYDEEATLNRFCAAAAPRSRSKPANTAYEVRISSPNLGSAFCGKLVGLFRRY